MAEFRDWLRDVLGRVFKIPKKAIFTLAALGVVFLVFLVLVAAGWEYSNSSRFCGYTCHTMKPQNATYVRSSHAKVPCASCHLGVGLSFSYVGRKAYDARDVYYQVTGTYERPIRIKSLRPARETCEKCHWPQAFHNDAIREIAHFNDDKDSTRRSTYLIMKIGGGTSREGRGYGIHWHVEQEVWYIATDEQKQNIPWVRVVDKSGKTIDYVDKEAKITPEFIAKADKRRMDCIDCHNRATHGFKSPEEAVEQAIALNQVDRGLPYIKKKAVEVFSASYPSKEAGLTAVEGLAKFYEKEYPDIYAKKRAALKTTIEGLKEAYEFTNFPEMKVTSETYPNNIGHKDYPGCARCHDGKHVTSDKTVSPQRQTIRLHCNICHSLPVNVREGQQVPKLPVIKAGEPASHLAADWMEKHRRVVDESCVKCHAPLLKGSAALQNLRSPEGFCSNSSCHNIQWKNVGFGKLPMAFGCETCHKPGTATPPTKEGCLVCHQEIPKTGLHQVQTHIDNGGKNACVTCHKPHEWTVSNRATCETCHVDKKEHNPGIFCGDCHNFRGQS